MNIKIKILVLLLICMQVVSFASAKTLRIYDYRLEWHEYWNRPSIPSQFKIQIVRDGKIMEERASANTRIINYEAGQQPPDIKSAGRIYAQVGDKVRVTDLTPFNDPDLTPIKWDFQRYWRCLEDNNNVEVLEVKQYNSFPSGNNYFEFEIERPGTYFYYLNVCSKEGDWSSHGDYRVLETNVTIAGYDAVWWYFTHLIVEAHPVEETPEAATAYIKHLRIQDSSLITSEEMEIIYQKEYSFTPKKVSNYEYVNVYSLSYEEEAKENQEGSGEVKITLDKDNPFKRVYINYYYDGTEAPLHGGKTVDKNLTAEGKGEIRSDKNNKGEYIFHVEKGIPVTEDLFVYIEGNKYLVDYQFNQVTGSETFTVTASRDFTIKWQIDEGVYIDILDKEGKIIRKEWKANIITYEREAMVSSSYSISRSYSYWVVDKLTVYTLEKAVIKNTALPNGEITLKPKEIKIPIEYKKPEKYIYLPSTSITLPKITINHGLVSASPSNPINPASWDTINNTVGQLTVKNETLKFNGVEVIREEGYLTNQQPEKIPNSQKITLKTESGANIKTEVLNGTHKSNGKLHYNRIPVEGLTFTKGHIEEEIPNINPVVVHTPVVCKTEIHNDKAFNQELKYSPEDKILVLGRSSRLEIMTTHQHRDIPGYGIKDYRKYIKDIEVKFPFDVYINTDKPEGEKLVRENNWITLNEILYTENHKSYINLHIPTWVKEGYHTIEYRNTAINAPNKNNTQKEGNLDLNNYVATYEEKVKVVGRLYGFKITDISDYPLWQNVFRKNKTTQHIGNYYWVGTKDENGRNRGNQSLYTLPILEGSHPLHKGIGPLKTGYSFKFQLDTIGEYYNNKDGISITPTFYHVGKDGERKQIDIYYTEYFNGKENYFVKLGSSKCNENTITMQLGDSLRNVPQQEITDTSKILAVTENSLKYHNSSIGWRDWINLTGRVRTFIGDTKEVPDDKKELSKKSVQRWYGQFSLPNTMYVAAKNFNVLEYAHKNNGLTGREDFWMKEGYIIVNFKIETVKDGDVTSYVLGYWNSENCNMWQVEGFNYNKGRGIPLKDGDVIFYHVDKKASDDYRGRGTH